MKNALIIPFDGLPIPENAEGHGRHRLALFNRWLMEQGAHWYQPDLAAYRDYLLGSYKGTRNKALSPASVKAHLATVRSAYRRLLHSNDVRATLYSQAPQDASAADKKAFVDEYLTRLANGIDPDSAPIKADNNDERPDSAQGTRLTAIQANTLLAAPFHRKDNTPLIALRDAAIIALMLCTGIREAELIALDVTDLRQKLGGELALHVRKGKGAKSRLIPYGGGDFALAIVDRWLQSAGITAGAVFRGFYKNGKSLRPGRLTVRAINQVLDKYPLVIEGTVTTINPHDLRRTYARRLYDAGVSILPIQQNLGHKDQKTTELYIGRLDASARKPPSLYAFDFGSVKDIILSVEKPLI